MSKQPRFNRQYQHFQDKSSCTMEYKGSLHATPSEIHKEVMRQSQSALPFYTLYEHHTNLAITTSVFGQHIGKEYSYLFYPCDTPVTHNVRVPALGHLELMIAKQKGKVPDTILGTQSFDQEYRGRYFDTTYEKHEWAQLIISELSDKRATLSIAVVQNSQFSEHQGVQELETLANHLVETYRPNRHARLKEFFHYHIF